MRSCLVSCFVSVVVSVVVLLFLCPKITLEEVTAGAQILSAHFTNDSIESIVMVSDKLAKVWRSRH